MEKILLIQTAFLGDVILATALVEKLHQAYPEAKIDFLVRRGNEGLLAGHPFLRKVRVFDKREKWRSMGRLIRMIRRERYDLVVNVQRFLTSGILAVASGASSVVGFDKNPLSFLYDRSVPHHIGSGDPPQHEVARNQALIAHLTGPEPAHPRLYPSGRAYKKVPSGTDYICIAPTSVWFTKQWPAERWIALIDALPSDHEIYLLGGPADREACAHIQRTTRHPRVLNRAGELSLLESAALMQHARMNYANDSAPVHLASATDAPITAIFCSTVPAFGFGPLSTRSRIVENSRELACRPCGLHGYRACPEGHFRCADIPIEEVLGDR